MKYLKNRGIAAAVMVVLIVGGLLIGSHRPLAGLVKETEAALAAGVEGDGYGIQGCLDDRAASAYNLVTVARRYLDENDKRVRAVLDARQELADAQTPPQKFAANRKLSEATEELYRELKTVDLPEKDAGYPDRIHADLLASEDIISRDGYNRAAEECNARLAQFPANILGPLTGVRPVEYFR